MIDQNPDSEDQDVPPARPAATLVLLQDRPQSPPRLLMLERAASMRFAGGALVFPGGAVDPGDRDLAATLGSALDADEAAARVAAIRETLEESGLAVGLVPEPDADTRARLRAGIETGEDFGALLAGEGLRVNLSVLVPFARWMPPGDHRRSRFDTRFYLARAPEGQEASVDDTENVSLIWATAEEILMSDRRIIFPTRRNLERLALFADYAAGCADAARHPVETIISWTEMRDGEMHICIPDHLGYPVTAQPLRLMERG